MKYSSYLLMMLFASCSSAQTSLLETRAQDGATFIATQGIFSGIDYIEVKKQTRKTTNYSLFYNCACKLDVPASLRKDSTLSSDIGSTWVAVTDTLGGFKYFDHLIPRNELYAPVQFSPADAEEIDMLKKSIEASTKVCCKKELPSLEKIIGYVRAKHN